MPHIQSKPWIVQKYGGTSIGKNLTDISGSIIPAYAQSRRVAIVCSARSGHTKSTGTTSLLLEAIRQATTPGPYENKVDSIIKTIEEDHLMAAELAIGKGATSVLHATKADIKKDCQRMSGLLKAAMVLDEISDRTTDRVLAIGETLSCRMMAGCLQTKGIPSKVIVLDDVVEEAYDQDHYEVAENFRKSPSTFLRGLHDVIARRISSCGNDVPVITGFFGAMPGSLIKSVSRGYSDLCAAMCAAALNAEELQIWKEVDGVFTADPRKIGTARLLATITTEEATELTYYGSEVIHPLTIEQLDGAGVMLRLKNVLNPQGASTIIHPSHNSSPTLGPFAKLDTEIVSHESASLAGSNGVFMMANGYYGPNQYRRRPTAVTVKEDITIVNIRSHGTMSPQTFLCRVSTVLETHNLAIDLISSSQQMLSLAICALRPRTLHDVINSLAELGIASSMANMSIVSVIGHRMRNVVGISAEILSSLASAGVNIYLMSQGASEINISYDCAEHKEKHFADDSRIVINAKDAQVALSVIHEKVLGIPSHEEKENAFAKGPWLY